MNFYDANLSGKAKKITSLAIICAVVLLSVVSSLYFYVRVNEIKELGEKYLTVFWTNFTVRTAIQALSFCIVFILFYVSTHLVCKNIQKTESPMLYVLNRFWGRVTVCVLLSVMASTFISETVYSKYLMFINSSDFGLVDPLFGNDIGYYIFSRPFLDALVNSFMSVWLVITVYCFLAYMVVYAVNGLLKFKRLSFSKPLIIHNAVNVAVYFLISAVTYKFRSEQVLYSNFGEFAGAGYTEINVWYNFYRVAPYLLIAITALALVFMLKGKYKAMLISAAVYPATYLLIALTAFGVQHLVTEPNEAVKELPYLQYNMTYTKLAFGIDNVKEAEYPADMSLTAQSLADNAQTFKSVRITDFDSTVSAVNSLQGIRNYYKFNDADVTRYTIDGTPTLVSLAAREIDKDNLSDSAKNYANEVLRFTHGFGAVMNPLNEVTAEGQPKFIIKDIPTVSQSGAPEITQPRIYYGETDDDYVIVNSSIKEIDYYDNSQEVEYSYSGAGGIRLGVLNRLIYAAKNADFRMLVSQYIMPDSKILINRNVKERAQKAAPFLKFDDDPYLVIDGEGRLKWIIDAYTTSVYYPYAQTYEGVNYIRNSAKAVIDAYDGTVDLYVTDKSDPIICTYMKMYPGVFIDAPVPEGIKEHLVYPEYLFKIQAEAYARYHVANPGTLYNKSDLWVFAREKHGKETMNIEPYYNLMNVEEFAGEEDFIIMIPYTLAKKDNMVGWLAADCDLDSGYQLVSYHFPKGKNVYGTMQIENRIDSDPAISKEMTLWGQGGSNVIRGNMLVVPVDGSLIYIEPIYISSNSAEPASRSAIPELKRVIVAYGDKIVMEPTLSEALEVIFEGRAPSGPVGTLEGINNPTAEENVTENPDVTQPPAEDSNPPLDKVIDSIIDYYNDAKSDSSKGDWSGFGKNMEKLDEAISELEQFRSKKR